MVYNIDSLDKIHQMFGDDSKIRKFYDKKIKELKKNGFYVDVILRDSKGFVELFSEIAKGKCDVDISENYTLVGRYEKKDGFVAHEWIRVSPKDFKFTYVDFNSYRDVMHVSNDVVYLNSFWGIYVESEKYHIHELIQYDFFANYWAICPVNMYDGGNNILPISDRYIFGINISHNGAIYSSWDEYVEAHRTLSKSKTEKFKDNIAKMTACIAENRKAIRENEKKLKRDMKMLSKVSFDG